MIIFLILLALIDSYSEVLRLIETKRWDYRVTYIKSWGMSWGNKWYKIFDSFHLLPGLSKNGLIICAISCAFSDSLFNISFFSQALNTIAQYVALIWGFWWVRNIGMHIIWMNKGYKICPIKSQRKIYTSPAHTIAP